MLTPMPVQTSRYLAGYFYTDTSGLFQTFLNEEVPAETPTSTLQGAMNAGSRSQWLVLVRPQGVVEVRAPTLNFDTHLTIHLTALDAAEALTGILHDAPGNP